MARFQIDKTGYEGFIGGIEQGFNRDQLNSYRHQLVPMDIQCFPFYPIIRTLGVKRIDYFSLDVDGAEEDILKTIPLEKVYIDNINIQYSLLNTECPDTRKASK